MTEEEIEDLIDDRSSLYYVKSRVEGEGFDYAFTNYSDFKEVKDKQFQDYRERYVASYEDLRDYLNENTPETDDIL